LLLALPPQVVSLLDVRLSCLSSAPHAQFPFRSTTAVLIHEGFLDRYAPVGHL
jgi:hypothetical protein